MTTNTGHTSAIRASKVIGTTVKDSSGERLGEVKDVVLDKQSNSILFGVMSFGGVLGMGEKYHPVPWAALDYDESRRRLHHQPDEGTAEGRAGGFARRADPQRRAGVSRIARSTTTRCRARKSRA